MTEPLGTILNYWQRVLPSGERIYLLQPEVVWPEPTADDYKVCPACGGDALGAMSIYTTNEYVEFNADYPLLAFSADYPLLAEAADLELDFEQERALLSVLFNLPPAHVLRYCRCGFRQRRYYRSDLRRMGFDV